MDVDDDAAAVQHAGKLGVSSMDTSAGVADLEQEVMHRLRSPRRPGRPPHPAKDHPGARRHWRGATLAAIQWTSCRSRTRRLLLCPTLSRY